MAGQSINLSSSHADDPLPITVGRWSPFARSRKHSLRLVQQNSITIHSPNSKVNHPSFPSLLHHSIIPPGKHKSLITHNLIICPTNKILLAWRLAWRSSRLPFIPNPCKANKATQTIIPDQSDTATGQSCLASLGCLAICPPSQRKGHNRNPARQAHRIFYRFSFFPPHENRCRCVRSCQKIVARNPTRRSTLLLLLLRRRINQ